MNPENSRAEISQEEEEGGGGAELVTLQKGRNIASPNSIIDCWLGLATMQVHRIQIDKPRETPSDSWVDG